MRWFIVGLVGVVLVFGGVGEVSTVAESFSVLADFHNPSGSFDGFSHGIAAVGNDVVIGAVYGGAAYFYKFNGSTWVQPAAPFSFGEAGGDYFGAEVAAVGNKPVVSAHGNDRNGPDAGAVYVFERNDSTWTKKPIYGKAAGDMFGAAVASLGSDILVGASQPGVSDGGWAYRYTFDDDTKTWKPLLEIRNPSPGVEDHFGRSIASYGDDILVGAPHDDTDGASSGIVYLFDGSTGAKKAELHNPSPDPEHDWFGYVHSIAVMGNKILIGAPGGDSAWLFDGPNDQHAKEIPNPRRADGGGGSFGNAVVTVGDYFLISAYQDDTDAPRSGTAYWFDADGEPVDPPIYNPTPETNDFFGHTVAPMGNNVLIGAFHAADEETGAANTGMVYLMEGVPEPSTFVLLSTGAVALLAFAWRRRRGR